MSQKVTIHVVEGSDKGIAFRLLNLPVSIGREEGNNIRLSDERISRFHAKIQDDNGEIILTDVESTNGTRVNGNTIHIRRLKAGDRISIGRSILLFGSESEIRSRINSISSIAEKTGKTRLSDDTDQGTDQASLIVETFDHDLPANLEPDQTISIQQGNVFLGDKPLPPLPRKLSPSQSARLAELFEYLHRQLTLATESMSASDEDSDISLKYSDWQKIQSIHLILAKYARAIIDPDNLQP